MTLAFQNPSRSFDASVKCVRFSGHDTAIEVSFFLPLGALTQIYTGPLDLEADILRAFDEKLVTIHKAATKAYKQNKGKYVCTLSTGDF